jgi:hypothetical protein
VSAKSFLAIWELLITASAISLVNWLSGVYTFTLTQQLGFLLFLNNQETFPTLRHESHDLRKFECGF